MEIRSIKKDDFTQLYKLWELVDGIIPYPYEEEKQRFETMLALNPHLGFVLEKDQKIIGSIIGGFDGRTASVHRLAIHPEYQKQGYGTTLLETLENELKKHGVRKLAVQVHCSNPNVIQYYKKKQYKDMDYAVTLYKDL